jgi:hypothetical protein
MHFNQSAEVDEDGRLACPKCGDIYIHQGNTTVFERREDDDYVTVIAQNNAEVTNSKFLNADTCNPSSRRHGMLIEFTCEECHSVPPEQEAPAPFRLAVYQHKGNTFVEWED